MNRQRRSFAKAILALLSSLLLLDQPCAARDGCNCTTNGLSNGVRTDSPGCALHDAAATRPYCFVKDSEACPAATDSSEYPGAATVPCSVDEALFFAAESDDVVSIGRFRELGASLNISRDVSYGERGSRVVSLIVFAAAHGSFQTVEDLLVYEDFVCEDQDPLRTELCRLSSARQCRRKNEGRQSIESFIDFVVEARCGQREVEDGQFTVEVAPAVPAPCNRYPYFVSVRQSFGRNHRHVCGGVLVSKETVLTAAHCLDGLPSPILIIDPRDAKSTDSSCPDQPEVRKGTRIATHPKWSKGRSAGVLGNGYDIALIKLNKASKKEPVEIQKKGSVKSGSELDFVGLGRQSQNSGLASVVQVAPISVVSKTTCQKDYDKTFPKNILCTGRDTEYCAGDEGGPLIKSSSGRDKLVGIAHMKHPSDICGTADLPGLFTDATRLGKWIKKKSKKL